MTEIDLTALQREAEVRAEAFWDPDEVPLMEDNPAPRSLSLALTDAIVLAADPILNPGNQTPFLGAAYLTAYLAGDHWKAVRTRALQRAGGHCARCHGRFRHLDVHHLTYRNLGQEREHELIVLCRECHQAEHGE